MKSNSIDNKSQKQKLNQVKVNLINNIPKTKTKKDLKFKPKISENKSLNNPINININNQCDCYNNNSNKEKVNFIKNISSYISINKSILLSAYEESLLILFETLKSYMKDDIIYFNNLKDNFIKNVQNFYQKNKNNFSTIIPSKKNIYKNDEIKIDNYVNYKSSIKYKNNSNSYLPPHKKNKSHINKSISKMLAGLSNNSISRQNSNNNKNLEIPKNLKKNKTITHKKSLYSLIRGNKPLISNSPIKDIIKKNYKFSILNNFVDLNKRIKNSIPAQNGRTITSEISNNGNIGNRNKEEKNYYLQNKEIDNKYLTNINNNINNNIYYNNIMAQIPDKIKNENYTSNKDLIASIKNNLDENLKGIFDFSYESFYNKESEREGN